MMWSRQRFLKPGKPPKKLTINEKDDKLGFIKIKNFVNQKIGHKSEKMYIPCNLAPNMLPTNVFIYKEACTRIFIVYYIEN